MGEIRNEYKMFLGKPEEKRPLGRHSHRWKYNIRIDVRETWREVLDWSHLA
jgi:hypothetical protein